MKNNSNIYDIDDNLIRASFDDHKWSVQEAQEKIDYYKNKLDELDKPELSEEDKKKIQIYSNYISNLSKYIFELYSKMTPEQLSDEISRQKVQADTDKQVENAINELKKEIEDEEKLENEESSEDADAGTTETTAEDSRGRTQEDFLVDRGDIGETIMDEYVPFEEVKIEENEGNIQQSNPV